MTFGNVDAVVEEIVVVRDIVEACWDTVAVGGIVAEDGSIAVHLVKMDVAGHGRVYKDEKQIQLNFDFGKSSHDNLTDDIGAFDG